MTVHTILDMSSMRRSVDLAFATALSWDDDDEVEEELEREVASLLRIASQSRMALFASRTNSFGLRRFGRPKRVAPYSFDDDGNVVMVVNPLRIDKDDTDDNDNDGAWDVRSG